MDRPETAAELVRGCYSFIPGDLVEAMELRELAEKILSEAELSGEQKSVIRKVRDLFEEGMKNGFSGDFEKRLEKAKTRLPALFPEESAQTGKSQEAEEQASYDLEVLDSFIQESQDHLENIEEQILGLEDNPDPVAVNSIFRSMHTIKGVASFIGLTKIKHLSHSLESVLDEIRSGKLNISTDMIDVLLAGVDLLTRMLGELIEKEEELRKPGDRYVSLDSNLDIQTVIIALGGILEKSEEPPEEDAGRDGIITPEMIAGFERETIELIEAAREYFDLYRRDASNTEPLSLAFKSLHTVKGNAGFLGYSSIEQVCANLQQVIDRLQQGDQPYDERVAAVIDDSLEALRKAVLATGEGDYGEASAAAAENEQTPAAAGKSPEGEGIGLKPLGEALVEMGEASTSAVDRALDRQQRKLGEILVESGFVEEEQVSKALEEQHKRQGQPEEKEKLQKRDIRVDTDKLDKLFDLMGELITAQAMVIDNPDLKKHNLERFEAAAGYLSKITREMQEVTMLVRMVPLEGQFNKLRRLVRDLSRSYDKKVNLELSGQDTEMDRNIMDDISDPLVNVIENAIRHGIESPGMREEAGKLPTGTISLDARYEGNEIWISVKDDGRGLDRDVIIEKSESLGLISSGDADKLNDTRVWSLILQPGFAAAVGTAGAGRGEGLHTVKRAIERLKGRVNIFSQKGKGTEILLRIPQTQAIIDGIIFKVADKLYSMPIGDVLSFHKAEAVQVTATKRGQEVLNLRGELIPILKLYEIHRIETEKRSVEEGIVVVILADNKKAALLVDEILDYKQLVVKPLPESMRVMRGVSGCSIMGDGNVSLIIDTPSLVHQVIE